MRLVICSESILTVLKTLMIFKIFSILIRCFRLLLLVNEIVTIVSLRLNFPRTSWRHYHKMQFFIIIIIVFVGSPKSWSFLKLFMRSRTFLWGFLGIPDVCFNNDYHLSSIISASVINVSVYKSSKQKMHPQHFYTRWKYIFWKE